MIHTATGHRPNKLGGYSHTAQQKLDQFAMAMLDMIKPERMIIGMAQGWDQACGVACIRLKIPFEAYIPFRGQESMWPLEARMRYGLILNAAANAKICNPGKYSAMKMQVRNVMMVDAARAVIALWDGSDGGTANCIAYAAKKQVPITNVWDQWQAFYV